ncbi:TRAP transporter small permease subunit [Siculibacillus lacustris]|uniref:TRAP transporter small permease protein n=1 Tax=Siculibacillus lacustris TaxID=1549641 RepID=A0A4Q9VZM7_9HYPH|nr:TRAP transporter small permease subunit [Siculibacillus lacustris]TBW40924.1 TRAP transporter small permease subunit [Siculibacillus lacustris]
MQALIGFSRAVDAFTVRLGRAVSWLLVAAIVISTLNAIIRKVFDASSNAWLEAQWLLFGAVFLICASWTLQANEHIRIDIVNATLSKRTRNVIELIGHVLFLLPMVAVILWTAVPFFTRSFFGNEQSFSAGGLPQWPAKSLVVIGFALLLVQGVSELIKRIAVMRGLIEDAHAAGGHHAAAEAEAERLLAIAEAERVAADGPPKA